MYRKILIGGVTAAAILGAGTAALAATGSTTSGSPAASSTSSAAQGKAGNHGKKRPLLARAAHAQITVKTKHGYVTHDLIKGTVTSVSATSITVQAGDKTSETYIVGSSTKVFARATTKGAKPTASSIGEVTKGQHVAVGGTGTTTLTAVRVLDLGSK